MPSSSLPPATVAPAALSQRRPLQPMPGNPPPALEIDQTPNLFETSTGPKVYYHNTVRFNVPADTLNPGHLAAKLLKQPTQQHDAASTLTAVPEAQPPEGSSPSFARLA